MGVAIKFVVLSLLSLSVVTGFTIFRRQSVRWQTLTPIDIREAGVDLPCPNEGFFQHPANCSRFYRCVDFVGTGQHFSKYMYECPKKLIFIESIETCLRAKCPEKSGSSANITSAATSIPTTPVSTTISTTSIPTTLISSTEKVVSDETSPVSVIETTTNAYMNLLEEKDKLKDVNETLSNVGSLLEETQDILQSLSDLLASRRNAIFILRENHGAKINTLKQYLSQLKEISGNSEKNLDEINLLTEKIKVLLVEIKELANQIKENKLMITSTLQNSVSSAINQTKDTSETVEQQKQQTIEKIEKIDEYITLEIGTTEMPEVATTMPETESYTTEEITTDYSDIMTTTPKQTDIVDITIEPSKVETIEPDFTTETNNTEEITTDYPDVTTTIGPTIIIDITDEPSEVDTMAPSSTTKSTNIETTTEAFETTIMNEIDITTIESFETTMIYDTQTTEVQDIITEEPQVSTEEPTVTTEETSESAAPVPKPWEAHKCQEVYTMKPPLTPEYSLRYCRGQLLGDRTRCNVFYQCSDLKTPYICTEGRVFDQLTQSCLIKSYSGDDDDDDHDDDHDDDDDNDDDNDDDDDDDDADADDDTNNKYNNDHTDNNFVVDDDDEDDNGDDNDDDDIDTDYATFMCQGKEFVLPTYNCGQIEEVYSPNTRRRTARTGPLSFSVRARIEY